MTDVDEFEYLDTHQCRLQYLDNFDCDNNSLIGNKYKINLCSIRPSSSLQFFPRGRFLTFRTHTQNDEHDDEADKGVAADNDIPLRRC